MPAKQKLSASEWISVEAAWMEGVQSVRAIARDAGVSESAVRQHCGAKGLIRDAAAAKRQRVAEIQARKDAEAAQLRTEAAHLAGAMVTAGTALQAGAERDQAVMDEAALAFAEIIVIERARLASVSEEQAKAETKDSGPGSDAKDSVVVLGGLKDVAATVKTAIEGYMKVRGLEPGEGGKQSVFEDWMARQGLLNPTDG